MFAKKFLSAITLLFIGSQLVSAVQVDAPAIPDCAEKAASQCGGDETADTFCIKSNKLYAIENVSGCYKVETSLNLSTVNIMSVSTANIAAADLNSDISGDIAKIAIYNCDDANCVRSYGFIKDTEKYYYIGTGDKNEEVTPTGNNCSGIIGTLNGSNALCLGYPESADKTVAFASTGDYLLSGTTAATNPFTADAASYDIPILVGANYMIRDAILDVEDYCVNENYLIEERAGNHCSSDECTYYDCSAGSCNTHTPNCASACDVSGTPSGCANGYYLYDGSNSRLATTAGDNGTLYYCEAANSCKVVGTSGGQTGSPIPTGYLVNADVTNKNSVAYIKCISGACTVIAVAEKSDCSGATNIGDMISVGANIFICNAKTAEGGIQVATADNGKKVFVDVSAASNAFGVTQNTEYPFVIAKLDGGNAILNGKDNTRYHYTDKTDTANVIKARKSAAICDGNSGNAREFKKDECGDHDVDYYKINSGV